MTATGHPHHPEGFCTLAECDYSKALLAGMRGESRPVDHTDAATYQPSDFSGLSLADLAEISVALSNVPASLQVMAVMGRVTGELDRRRTGKPDVTDALAAAWTRLRARSGR